MEVSMAASSIIVGCIIYIWDIWDCGIGGIFVF